jgi:hypothetical protein
MKRSYTVLRVLKSALFLVIVDFKEFLLAALTLPTIDGVREEVRYPSIQIALMV